MGATIKDISKKTGLGYATISAYLNGVKIRPANKEAIEKAIDELGYVRNEYARGLKTRKSMTVGAVILDLNNSFSMSVLSAIEEELRNYGYSLIISDCKHDAEREKTAIKFLQSKMIDGLVVMPTSSDAECYKPLLDNKIPIVAFDRIVDDPTIPTVTVDNRESSYRAVKLFLEKGHKNIAIIGNQNEPYTAVERHKGYQQALEEKGLYNENLVFNGNMTTIAAFNAMEDIILNHSDTTAVFITNYEMLLGSIAAINKHNLKIGEDISIIGFDSEVANKVLSPKITAINQPLADIGINACQLLIKAMNNEPVASRKLLTTIEIGNSIKDLN